MNNGEKPVNEESDFPSSPEGGVPLVENDLDARRLDYFKRADYELYSEALLAGRSAEQLRRVNRDFHFDLKRKVDFDDLPASERQKIAAFPQNEAHQRLERFLLSEGRLFGLEVWKLRRILGVYPVPVRNLGPNTLNFPDSVPEGERPVIGEVNKGDRVAFMVTSPYPGQYGTRYTAEPVMSLLAMRHVDLLNHLHQLWRLGLLDEATEEIKGWKPLQYGVYAPDYDDEKWVDRLKEAIKQLRNLGAEVEAVFMTMVSQSAARNQASAVRKVGAAFPEILILEGGNGGFTLGSFDKKRRSSEGASVGHGFLVGAGEAAICSVLRHLDQLKRSGSGDLSPKELPYAAVSRLMDDLEKGDVPGVQFAKLRTSQEGDIDSYDSKTAKKRAPEKMPFLSLPKAFYFPYSLRFDGNVDAEGNPMSTMWVEQDQGCVFGCSFCGYPQNLLDNTELSDLLYRFAVFARKVEQERQDENCDLAHWNEVPTMTALPPRAFVETARLLFNGQTLEKLFDPEAMQTVFAYLKSRQQKVGAEGSGRNFLRYVNFINFLLYLKTLRQKYGERFRWQMMTRIDSVLPIDNPDKELYPDGVGPEEKEMGKQMLLQLCAMGLDYVSASPESMNDRVLQLFNKGFSAEHYERYVDLLVENAEETVPGTEKNLKDHLRIGASFIMSVPDIERLIELKNEGLSPQEAKNLVRTEWFERRKKELPEATSEQEAIDLHLKGEGVGMVDSIADLETLMTQLGRLIGAGYNVSFAANHLTPLAPRNAHELKRDKERDFEQNKSWWSAYLWLNGISQAEFADNPAPNYGVKEADKFESRFDAWFNSFMTPEESAAYWRRVVGVFADTFGHPEAVARQGNIVFLRDGRRVELAVEQEPLDLADAAMTDYLARLQAQFYGDHDKVVEYLVQKQEEPGLADYNRYFFQAMEKRVLSKING